MRSRSLPVLVNGKHIVYVDGPYCQALVNFAERNGLDNMLVTWVGDIHREDRFVAPVNPDTGSWLWYPNCAPTAYAVPRMAQPPDDDDDDAVGIARMIAQIDDYNARLEQAIILVLQDRGELNVP